MTTRETPPSAEGGGLGPNEVGTWNIEDGAITTEKIAELAVSSSKMKNYSINSAKLALESVTTEKIADSAVSSKKLNNSSITAAKIASGAVTVSKLNFTPGAATYVVASDGSGDYSKIQKAINNLPSSGGSVYVKEGTYTISSAIDVPSDVKLVGSGYSTVISVNDTVYGIESTSTSNVLISSLQTDGSSNATDGIHFENVENSKIISCWVHDATGQGILLAGSQNNMVINNYSSNNTESGIKLDWSNIAGAGSSNHNIISSNICKNNGYHGLLLRGTSPNNTISGNEFSKNTKSGVYLSDEANNNNFITANHIFSNENQGINIDGANCTSTKIVSNYIHNNTNGSISDNGTNTKYIEASDIGTGAITSTEIEDRTIQTIDIALDNITSNLIENRTIQTIDISLDNITSALIENGTIQTIDIANDNITRALIETSLLENIDKGATMYNNPIETDNIADENITSTKVQDNNLLPSDMKFAPGSATYVVATSTDNGDYTSISEAISALPASGGMVYVKEGTYTISSAITIPSDVTLVGSGYSTVISVNDTVNGIESTSTSNVLISSLQIDGSSNATNGIKFDDVENSKIISCWVHDATEQGILLAGSDKNIVTNNHSLKNGQSGIQLGWSNTEVDGSDYNIISSNICKNNGSDGLYLQGISQNNTISGNEFSNNDQSGINIDGSGDSNSYNFITANQLFNNENCGIDITGSSAEGNKIASNYIHNNTSRSISDNGTNTIYAGVETQNGSRYVKGNQTINFSPSFPGTPNVTATAENTTAKIVTVDSVSQSSFNVYVWDTSGTADNSTVQWTAVWYP